MDTLPTTNDDGNEKPSLARQIAGELSPMIAVDRIGMAVREVEIAIVEQADAGATFDAAAWQDLDLSINALLANGSRRAGAGDLRQARVDLTACAIGVLSKLAQVITAEMKGGAL